MKYDSKKVYQDRDEGMSIRKIAAKHGISPDTVQRLLKRREMKNDVQDVVDEIYSIAISKQGISSMQEYSLLKSVGENTRMKAIRAQCRRKAEKDGEVCKFVPGWLYGGDSRRKLNSMLQSAQTVYEKIQDEVDEMLHEQNMTDISCVQRKEMIHYLITLATGSEGEVIKRCEHLNDLVNILGD